MTDLEALRRLPGVLLDAGYADAVGVYAVLPLGRPAPDDLPLLPPHTAALVGAFARRLAVPAGELAAALGAEIFAALVRLGVLIERDGRASTGQLVALPVDGRIAFVPSPPAAPDAYASADMQILFARMMPTYGSALILGGGAGLLALRAAITARRVVAVETDAIALGCAELTSAMNAVDDRVETRAAAILDATDALAAAGERFERVIGDLPGTPVPLAAGPDPQLDGPEVARRVLLALPDLLAPGGAAQLTCAWHGTADGPSFGFDLPAHARAHNLRIAATLPSRQSLAVTAPLLERLAAHAARAGRTTPAVVRQRYADHVAARGSTYLYLSVLTIRHVEPGEPEPDEPGELTLTRHYTRDGGGWSR